MDHSHGAGITDWAGGAMNGWDKVPGTSTLGDNLAYKQYHEDDIPNYWAYARTFTLADHFFSQMIGPSFPGHLAVLAAQAGWAVGNPDTNPYGLGFRLPLIIISPYAKPGFIFREVAEHASIPRFIERIMGSTQTLSDLDPAAQDGQANDLMNAFDFTQQPLPPLVLQTRRCL